MGLRKNLKNILTNEDFFEVIKGAGTSGFYTVIYMLLSYIIVLLGSRWFGAKGMGFLAIVNVIITFSIAIGTLGVNSSIIRYINQWKGTVDQGKIKSLIKSTFLYITPYAILYGLVFFLLRNELYLHVFNEEGISQLFKYIALLLPFIILGAIFLDIVKGLKKILIYNLSSRLIKGLIQLATMSIFYYFFYSEYGAAYGLLIGTVLSFGICIPIVIQYYKGLPEGSKVKMSKILETSLPMMVTGLAGIIMYQTDIIMLGIYVDSSSIGVYHVSNRIAGLIPFGLTAVNTIIGQKFAELYFANKSIELQKVVRLGSFIGITIGSVILLGIVFFGTEILSLFGKDFGSSGTLLTILSIGRYINTIAGSTGTYMNMTGKQKIQQFTILFTAVINILLNLWLIPEYGNIGAAISSLISFVIRNTITVVYIRRQDSINMYFDFKNPFVQ